MWHNHSNIMTNNYFLGSGNIFEQNIFTTSWNKVLVMHLGCKSNLHNLDVHQMYNNCSASHLILFWHFWRRRSFPASLGGDKAFTVFWMCCFLIFSIVWKWRMHCVSSESTQFKSSFRMSSSFWCLSNRRTYTSMRFNISTTLSSCGSSTTSESTCSSVIVHGFGLSQLSPGGLQIATSIWSFVVDAEFFSNDLSWIFKLRLTLRSIVHSQ